MSAASGTNYSAVRTLCRSAMLSCCWCAAVLPARAQDPQSLPRVASINLCADQLVLRLADPEQILSVSWLAADPEESMFAEAASAYTLNFGSAEELLRLDPDVVIAGAYTGAFARTLLGRLGYTVVEIQPAIDADGIERNLRAVGAPIGQFNRAEQAIEEMRRQIKSLAERRGHETLDAVLVRPGGFTTGAHSLAATVMAIGGLDNVAARHGLDRWGSLSMETLLRSAPDILLITDYRAGEASLANTILEHPVLEADGLPQRIVRLPGKHWACGLPESLEAAEIIVRSLSGTPRRIAISGKHSGGP